MNTTVTVSDEAFSDETLLETPQDNRDRPCRTILFLDHTAKLGGGEIALLNLVSALDKTRYHPIVALAADGPLVGRLRAAGIQTVVVPLDLAVLETRKDSIGLKSLLRIGQAWACLAYAFRLARLARRLGADLIHTNSLKSDLYGGLAGRIARVPVLWHVRDSIDGQYLPSLVATTFRRLSHFVPNAVVANSESTLRTLRPMQRQIAATVYSGWAASSSDPILDPVLMPPDQDEDLRHQVVHDGYETQAFIFSPGDDIGDDRPAESGTAETMPPPQRPAVIALVGRIAEWKGQHIFLQAAALVRETFPQARYQIIGAPLFGEHEYEQSLHRMVSDLGLTDRVSFLGFRNDVPALLASADIMVHASTLGEPFGQVVIEGMAAGKPVIATNGGALPEIVLPDETGLLVPMGDAPAMAEAMKTLLTDPVRAAAMGAAGRRRVRERFTISQTVRKMESIYERLLK